MHAREEALSLSLSRIRMSKIRTDLNTPICRVRVCGCVSDFVFLPFEMPATFGCSTRRQKRNNSNTNRTMVKNEAKYVSRDTSHCRRYYRIAFQLRNERNWVMATRKVKFTANDWLVLDQDIVACAHVRTDPKTTNLAQPSGATGCVNSENGMYSALRTSHCLNASSDCAKLKNYSYYFYGWKNVRMHIYIGRICLHECHSLLAFNNPIQRRTLEETAWLI